MKKTNNQKQSRKGIGALPLALLGGISPQIFFKEYWQKKPLLIRNAMPGFKGLLSAEELAGLACEEDVQSRLVSQVLGKWRLEHGPFEETRFSALPEKNWTLLVQSVNHHLSSAADLLSQFEFIPHARLDDLMVSYAPEGGGVGPHFDSYDVFLLQGQGRRLWRISEQTDLSLVDGAPLKLLENFRTEEEWILGPGDMLYLPPRIAHWGIAVDDCMTYSIGFRAPAAQELGIQFLSYLQENLHLDGGYEDADIEPQKHPAKIGKDMVARVNAVLKQIKWDKEDVGRFLGCYLSEPKAHIVFDTPGKKMKPEVFDRKLRSKGVALSLKSHALFDNKYFYINGERIEMEQAHKQALGLLADKRYLSSEDFKDSQSANQDLVDIFYAWYKNGYLTIP